MCLVTWSACGTRRADRSTGRQPDEPTPDPATAAVDVDAPGIVPWDDRAEYAAWQPPGLDYPSEPPSRWPGLRARLVLPSTVHADQTVDYVVVLRNTTRRRVDLRPCGAYRQEVQVVGAGIGAGAGRGRLDGVPAQL